MLVPRFHFMMARTIDGVYTFDRMPIVAHIEGRDDWEDG